MMIMNIKCLSMLFLSFLASVSAIPTRVQLPSTSALLNPLLLKNASNFTSPSPPANYGILLKFDDKILLNPLGVYLNAMELMYLLAQEDWDSLLYKDLHMSVTAFNIWILAAGAPSNELRFSHVVIALGDSIIAMARLKVFVRLSALISLGGQMVGHMEFGSNESPSNNETSASLAKDTLLLVSNNSLDGSLGNSGQIVDPYDSKLVITYESYGKGIDSKEIFTVFLDGLAISAQFKPSENCPVLEASSMSGTVAISISRIPGEHSTLCYSAVTKTLLMIVTRAIVPRRMFKELEFSISYDGVNIAEGFMFKLALANNGTGETAVSKQR